MGQLSLFHLYFPPSEPAALHTNQWLKQKYLAHDSWQRWRDVPRLMQFDQRLGQLQKSASDQLKRLDYSTCYKTMDRFPSQIIPVSVKSLVNKLADCSSQVFLIKAPPGMGKSLLMANICRYWALGLGMRAYTLVFWVDMAALQHPAATLNDLLRGVNPGNRNTAHLHRWIEGKNGKGIMFILDGWNQEQSYRITKRLVSKDYLSKSTVVLMCTSTSPSLGRYQFDLLGLTSAQICKQVAHYHSTDPLKAEAVLLHLASNPDMKQLASFPVYLYAMLHISDHVSPSDLPDTWTEMFTLLTLLLMDPLFPEHDLQSKLSEYTDRFPTNLPNTIKAFVDILCNATSHGFKSNHHQSKFPKPLLNSSPDMNKGFAIIYTEQTCFFKFTFPLLQQFLAAVYIHQLPAMEQRWKMVHDSPFMWQFYAGLSKSNEQLSVLHEMYSQDHAIKTSTCFYEAGLTPPTPYTDFSDRILTSSDVHHVLVLLRGMIHLQFQRCCLGTETLEQLSKVTAYLYPERVEGTQIRYEQCLVHDTCSASPLISKGHTYSFQACKLSDEGLGNFGTIRSL